MNTLRKFPLFSAILLFAALTLRAQLQPCGSMTPISFPEQASAWWPDSLRPVMVSHIGRHGARFLSSEKKVADVEKQLDRARLEGTLTRKGVDAMGILQQVRSATGTDWGMLTPLGYDEEAWVASQIVSIAPELMKSGKVEGIATEVPRVVQTMYALSTGLARYSDGLEITASDGRQYSPWLRCFVADSAYVAYLESGPWKAEYDRYFAATVPTAPAEALVGKGWRKDELQKLTMDMYAVMQGMPAAGLDISSYLWFSDGEMQACASVSNLLHYLRRCASPAGDEPARAAIPLLRLMLSLRLPDAEAPCGTVALLRFGHAETLLPLFSLMGLPGCDNPKLTPENLAATFDVGLISPLGANLQLYYLEAPSGRRYVAALMNGRPVPPAPGSALIIPVGEFNRAMNERIAHFSRNQY